MDIKNIYRNSLPESARTPLYRTRRRFYRSLIRLNDPSVLFMHPRLKKMRGMYTGQRCFLMGNGPSLNKMDLNVFQNEFVWGSNRCYLLFERLAWRPKFYVAVDTRVVPDNADEINALSQKMPNCSFFFPVHFRYQRILNSSKNVYWYQENSLNEKKLPYSMFSTNAANFIYSVRTVTVAMLQLAVYLGFNPIYLIGCDTNYTVPKTVQYENEDANKLISTEHDLNHFDPRYFGAGKKWHEPHVERMIFHYEQAKKVCDEINVQVFNATIGGNLEVFPRVNYQELFE